MSAKRNDTDLWFHYPKVEVVAYSEVGQKRGCGKWSKDSERMVGNPEVTILLALPSEQGTAGRCQWYQKTNVLRVSFLESTPLLGHDHQVARRITSLVDRLRRQVDSGQPDGPFR